MFAYYAALSPQAARDFNREFQEALRQLTETPHIGSRRYAHLSRDGNTRVWRLDCFPFLTFYRVDDDTIDVVRLLHERRRITRPLIQTPKRRV